MNNYPILLFPLLLLGLSLHAQVEAPDFICVRTDTLVWEPVVPDCGPILGYNIFFSETEAGPYQLLTTIDDPTVTEFFHVEAQSRTFFYYLTTETACAAAPLSSDTLDNRIPLPGPVSFVSITDDGVVVQWRDSPSPEVIGYVVQRTIPQVGTVILDTVFNTNTFLDTGADPEERRLEYFVVAIDACGNNSLVPIAHQTMLISTTSPDTCDAGIQVSWSGYMPMEVVSDYVVFASVDGGAFNEVGTVDRESTTFRYTGGNSGETLCFRVAARTTDGDLAFSGTSCQTINVPQPLRDVTALSASVTADNNVSFSWQWDPAARIAEASLERFPVGDPGQTVSQPIPLSQPLTILNTFLDTTALPGATDYTYRLRVTDVCGAEVVANTTSTILVSAISTQDGGNQITWTSLQNESISGPVRYDIYRITPTGESLLNSATEPTRSLTDRPDPEESPLVCYRVEAFYEVLLPSGAVSAQVSVSNTVCIQPESTIYVPNVFSPVATREANRTFRPFVERELPMEYELQIFDRWGNPMFITNDPGEGWDGITRGEPAATGVYFYFFRFTRADGTVVFDEGTVTLIR